VEEDTTVALIEVMKLFNPVQAGLRGRIHKICVDNGSLVEYGQPLFLVKAA
jgi:biotin carboxyl carrier protein